MVTGARTRRRGHVEDSGFTLVEMLVSLFIVSMTLLASLYFATGYFKTSHDTFSRTNAIQLASERVESLRALPWASLGLFTSEYPTPYPTCPGSCASEAAVTLSGVRSASPSAPTPSQVVNRGNINFLVTMYVTWSQPATQASGVKHIVVKVSWNASGAALSVVSDGLRSPLANRAPSTASPSASATPTTSPSPSASPTASAPLGTPTITSVSASVTGSASPSPICINTATTPYATKYAETDTVIVENATANDDISARWPGNPTVFYNTGSGVGTSSSMVFTFTFPPGVSGSGTSLTSVNLTIVVTRATDGAVNATSNQAWSLPIRVGGC